MEVESLSGEYHIIRRRQDFCKRQDLNIFNLTRERMSPENTEF